MSLLVDLVLLAGPFVGFGHLDHTIIFKLLMLGIVNELPNLEMSGSMNKEGLSYVTPGLQGETGTSL